tara:strand:+ start:6443 stop:7501 length:1059 start_codon:yes stop_codon:yes gene_type:complete
MKMHLLTLTLSLTTLAACGKDEAKPETKTAATETTAPTPETKPVPEAKPVAPRDARIVALFEAGKDCSWDAQGMTQCPTAKEIKDLAFNNQGSSELAASCAGALTDASPSVRGLAATCIQGFNDNTRSPQIGAGLDAFEAAKEPGMRRLMAWSFGRGNATKAGFESRVISLVEKLSGSEDENVNASYFFGTLFPQYMVNSAPPSKEAGDFALKIVKTSEGALQKKAIEALGLLTDREAEVCPVLVELTTEEMWPDTVPSMAKVGGACLEDLDTILGFMMAKLNTGKFFAGHAMALRPLLRKASLSDEQFAALKKASKTNLDAHKKTAYGNTAKKLMDEIAAYKDPALQPAAK